MTLIREWGWLLLALLMCTPFFWHLLFDLTMLCVSF